MDRRSLAIALKVLLLAWPATHVVLSLFGGVSSWKLAGWGMYATNHPVSPRLKVVFLETLELPESLGFFAGGRQVAHVEDRELHELSLRALAPETRGELRGLEMDLRVLRWSGPIARYAAATEAAFFDRDPPPHALVVLAEPRLSLFRDVVYQDVEVYLYHRGEVRRLGAFDTEALDEAEILKRLGWSLETELVQAGKPRARLRG